MKIQLCLQRCKLVGASDGEVAWQLELSWQQLLKNNFRFYFIFVSCFAASLLNFAITHIPLSKVCVHCTRAHLFLHPRHHKLLHFSACELQEFLSNCRCGVGVAAIRTATAAAARATVASAAAVTISGSNIRTGTERHPQVILHAVDQAVLYVYRVPPSMGNMAA